MWLIELPAMFLLELPSEDPTIFYCRLVKTQRVSFSNILLFTYKILAVDTSQTI